MSGFTGLTGDFTFCRKSSDALRILGSGFGVRRVNRALAEEALTQVKLGFRHQRDPDGLPWPRLKSRTGEALRKSGRLQNSFTVGVASNTTFVLGTNVRYAWTHQKGATIVPVHGKFLRFGVQTRTFSFGTGTYRTGKAIVFAKKVVIPRRQMMPEGELGLMWAHAFEATANEAIAEIVKGK